jgi:hypothetical protein
MPEFGLGRPILTNLIYEHAASPVKSLVITCAQGLALARRITLEGWVTLVLVRKR